MLDLAFFLLVKCPTVGFMVVIGGHVVGNMMDGRTGTIGVLQNYWLLVVLGFITIAIHMSVSGQLEGL